MLSHRNRGSGLGASLTHTPASQVVGRRPLLGAGLQGDERPLHERPLAFQKPEALNPRPSTLNDPMPKPEALNTRPFDPLPKPEALNPQPSTLNDPLPKPEALNP